MKKLNLHGCEALTDLSPLAEIATLEKLTVPVNARNIEVLRTLPKLGWIGFDVDPKNVTAPATSAEQFWKDFPTLSWMRSLQASGIKYSARRGSSGTWKVSIAAKEFSECAIFKGARISELTLEGTSVTDLAPLAGLPLKVLQLRKLPAVDLSPLASLALEELRIEDMSVTNVSFLRQGPLCDSLQKLTLEKLPLKDFSPVAACQALTLFAGGNSLLADLSPLKGKNLRSLYISSSRVRDLSVVAGMPLFRIFFDASGVTDTTPLLKCPTLGEIILPKGARGAEALCNLPKLQRISYTYDAKLPGPSKSVSEFMTELSEQ